MSALAQAKFIERPSFSPEQNEVIGFLKTRFDTFCFSDPDHGSPLFMRAVTSEEFQNHFASRKIFIERTSEYCPWIAALETGAITHQDFIRGLLPINRYESGDIELEPLAVAIANRVAFYRAADPRTDIFTPGIAFIRKRIGRFFALAAAYIKDREVFDDGKVVQNILAQLDPGEPCVITYGALHFIGVFKAVGFSDMIDELIGAGRKPALIDISTGSNLVRLSKKIMRTSDADLRAILRDADLEFILPHAGEPGQVIFNNKELEAAYAAYAETKTSSALHPVQGKMAASARPLTA